MNKLKGKISGIQSSENISFIQVEVEGDVFSSMQLEGKSLKSEYKTGDTVTLLFKETEVGIAKHLKGMISLRNRFKGVIREIKKGPILARVLLGYRTSMIESLISTQSSEAMKLIEGEEVEWLVKSNEMMLLKDP